MGCGFGCGGGEPGLAAACGGSAACVGAVVVSDGDGIGVVGVYMGAVVCCCCPYGSVFGESWTMMGVACGAVVSGA